MIAWDRWLVISSTFIERAWVLTATITISYGFGAIRGRAEAAARSLRWILWRPTADLSTRFPTTHAIRIWVVGAGTRTYKVAKGVCTRFPNRITCWMSAVFASLCFDESIVTFLEKFAYDRAFDDETRQRHASLISRESQIGENGDAYLVDRFALACVL